MAMNDPNPKYADLHCHPNLKTYGHSFSEGRPGLRSDLWFTKKPGIVTKLLNIFLGITRFNQSDFTTMARGGARLVFVSLYPFEKGFFINAAGRGFLSAYLSNQITGIGYRRIRNIQQHTDYFRDLEREYDFVLQGRRSSVVDGEEWGWHPVTSGSDFECRRKDSNEILVFFSIEGAHVFNTGLGEFGRQTSEEAVIENIRKVKQWKYPPVYITFAHNFNNDLCGHARSLEPIERFVDQSAGLDSGFTELGYRALEELLTNTNGPPVLIDLKHMSLSSRRDYYRFVRNRFADRLPPTIVSHGAVNGMSFDSEEGAGELDDFYRSDINFYDEEIEFIGDSGGLFAVQFDARRIARFELVKKNLGSLKEENDLDRTAEVIWKQLQHIALILDRKGHFAWGHTCIGSDYDGTIDPLPGVWTAAQFPLLYERIRERARAFLDGPNGLIREENRNISPTRVADRFFLDNTGEFLKRYYSL